MIDQTSKIYMSTREEYFADYFRSLRAQQRRRDFCKVEEPRPTGRHNNLWQRFKKFRQGEQHDIDAIASFFTWQDKKLQPNDNLGRTVVTEQLANDGGIEDTSVGKIAKHIGLGGLAKNIMGLVGRAGWKIFTRLAITVLPVMLQAVFWAGIAVFILWLIITVSGATGEFVSDLFG